MYFDMVSLSWHEMQPVYYLLKNMHPCLQVGQLTNRKIWTNGWPDRNRPKTLINWGWPDNIMESDHQKYLGVPLELPVPPK